jgi:HEAT repeat protein
MHCPKTALPRAVVPIVGALLCFAAITNHAYAAGISTETAWKILDGGVADPSVDKRAQAVSALGMLSRDAHAERLAVKALGDEKPEVRAAAATALGAMRAVSAIPALRKALKDPEVSVVLAAAQSLLTLKDNTAYEVYYAVLTGQRKGGEGLIEQQKKMLEDRKKMTELAVTTGIGFIPFGGIGMTVYKTVTKDDASPVRAAAAKLLAHDPDPKSAEALVAAASDKSWIVRTAAVDAIGRRGERSLAEKIAPQLEDEKSVVQYAAAAAIVHLSELPASRPR